MAKPITHLSLTSQYRGAERQLEILIRGASEWGIKQRLIVPEGSTLATEVEHVKGLDIVYSGMRKAQVARACKGSELVHAYDLDGLRAAHRAFFFSNVPYVVTQRDELLPPDNWLTRRRYRKAKRVVAVSNAVRKALLRDQPKLAVKVIHSSASAHPTYPGAIETLRQRFNGKYIVGHIGSLDDARKGQSDIIEVARNMARTHEDVVFVLIGDGPDEAALKKRAAGLPNVEFAGHVRNPGDFLSIMSIFAYPSRQQGLGAALLDAMDFSRPVVATAVGGVPEIVQDGKNGLLVNPGNIDQLEFAIKRLLSDGTLRARLGKAGNLKVQAFTPQAMVEHYLELFQDVMTAKS